MPQIRVVNKTPSKPRNIQKVQASFPISSQGDLFDVKRQSAGGPASNLMSLQYKKVDRKPKIDFELMISKLHKKLNGEEKTPQPTRYVPAKPDHMYDRAQIAVRKIWRETVRDQTHMLDIMDYDNHTGEAKNVVLHDFMGNQMKSPQKLRHSSMIPNRYSPKRKTV